MWRIWQYNSWCYFFTNCWRTSSFWALGEHLNFALHLPSRIRDLINDGILTIRLAGACAHNNICTCWRRYQKQHSQRCGHHHRHQTSRIFQQGLVSATSHMMSFVPLKLSYRYLVWISHNANEYLEYSGLKTCDECWRVFKEAYPLKITYLKGQQGWDSFLQFLSEVIGRNYESSMK